jgi:hypothetical protein
MKVFQNLNDKKNVHFLDKDTKLFENIQEIESYRVQKPILDKQLFQEQEK